MASGPRPGERRAPWRSPDELAPLELACMNTLWPMGEGTVRQIRERLAPRRARAYTTIMTIMSRLARKGVVEQRKDGRRYIYRPRLSAQEARRRAVARIVNDFFGGSKDSLLAELNASPEAAGIAPSREKAAPMETESAQEMKGTGT